MKDKGPFEKRKKLKKRKTVKQEERGNFQGSDVRLEEGRERAVKLFIS